MAIGVNEHLKRFLDWRQPGGALSAAGHAAILVAGVYAFSTAQPFQPAVEAVAVDVVSDQQFNEMMKGDKTSKVVAKEPERRIDRVAETKEDKDPGLEKKDTPVQPTKQESRNETTPEQEQKLAAIVPPMRPPALRVAPPVPTPPAKAEEEEDEIDEQAELLRKKKIEDQKKLDDAAKAAEAKRKLDEKLKAEAEAQKRADDKKKLDEKLKAEAEAEKRAEEKRIADAKKKAKDDKARKDREAKEAAEQENKLFASINNKLQTSKEAPSSTGSTGAAVSNRSTAGTATATGKKLSPSDRSQLIGILTEQMNRCISYSGTAPKTGPQLTFTLSREGGINGGVQLANGSGESNFRPFSEAAMRALRNCQPYRIPARFMDSYDDWKNVRLNIDTSDMQ